MRGEENIDISQHAGGDREKARVWDSWARRHFREMAVAKLAGLVRSRAAEEAEWRNVVEHMLVVNAVAVWLARNVARVGQQVDVRLVDEASMLHDVDKRKLREQGISRNDERGSAILGDLLREYHEGHEHQFGPDVELAAKYTGRVPQIFEGDTTQDAAIAALPLEHLLIAYADARVRNDEIVSLEEARDQNKEKIRQDAGFYDHWYRFYKKVEKRIFDLIGVEPSSLSNASVFTMVKAEVG